VESLTVQVEGLRGELRNKEGEMKEAQHQQTLTQYEDTEEKDRLHSEVSRLKKMLGTTASAASTASEARKDDNTEHQQLLEKVKVLEMERRSLLK